MMEPKSLDDLVSGARVRVRKAAAPAPDGKCIVYWMQRSQRGLDNPALDLAVKIANRLGLPAVVYFAPVPWYPRANWRHYAFLNEGISDIRRDLEQRRIGFVLRRWPNHSLDKFIAEVEPAALVSDENPMREPEHWRQAVATRAKIPFYTVDSDVVVPSKLFAKEQYAAFHMRKRLYAHLDEFLVPQENTVAKHRWTAPAGIENLPDDTDITKDWEIDRSVKPVDSFRGGTQQALRLLDEFVSHKLANYAEMRNHADKDGTSRLSPYLHFGHLSPITVALAVKQAKAPAKEKESFLDELLVWREVAINLVTYNKDYDSLAGADRWARESLREHARDERSFRYSRAQFERSETHDLLWNAANNQMVNTGWMHNYMRMYWAKKLLEWSASPRQAYETAVALNDKYFLCGRDPNGYAGIAWAIAGKRDRPWYQKPVTGLIRTMSESGARKKFDVDAYIRRYAGNQEELPLRAGP